LLTYSYHKEADATCNRPNPSPTVRTLNRPSRLIQLGIDPAYRLPTSQGQHRTRYVETYLWKKDYARWFAQKECLVCIMSGAEWLIF